MSLLNLNPPAGPLVGKLSVSGRLPLLLLVLLPIRIGGSVI